MTDAEKAKAFRYLLNHEPSVLTVCESGKCGLKHHIRKQYPDMITLEWRQTAVPDLTVDERGVSGTLEFGFVWMPWDAIVNVRPSPRPSLRVIKGGK